MKKNNNWQTKKLNEVCNIINGSTPLRSNKEFWNNGNIPWFTINDIREQGRIIKYTKQKVTQKAFSKKSERILPEESVLLCCTASVGEYAITKIKLSTNQQFNGLVIKDKKILDPMFLYYFSSTLKYQLLNLSGKATIDFISISKLGKVEIPIPSIIEQKKIVRILNETFKQLEIVKENTEKNLQNSKELFETYINNIFSNPENDWSNLKLYELSKNKNAIVSGPFGSNLKVSDYKESGVPILRLQNIGKGYFIDKDIKYITKNKAEELKYHSFTSGDIVLAKLGIPIGKTCIVPDNFKSGIIVADVVRIRPDKNIADYKFIEYFLNTDISVKQLTGNISGATRPRVNLSDVRNINISIPNLNKQEKIVEKLDKLSEKTKRLEEIYKKKLEDIEELKKSILNKAFNGEL